jgi:hypothetical protein
VFNSPAPDALIRPIIKDFVAKGYSNTDIVIQLRKYYDTDMYNVSWVVHFLPGWKHTLTSHFFLIYRVDLLKKRRSQWGLKSARGQAHTITSVGPAIEHVRAHFPKQGSHDMKLTLMHKENVIVSRYAVFFGRISALW